MQHSGLIYVIARRYLPLCDRATDIDDLMQAGAIGVIRAEKTYDPRKGAFGTWAGYYIQLEIQAALGLRGKRIRAHRGAVSLDAQTTEEMDGTLADTIPDPSADFQERQDMEELQTVVQECVAALENATHRELVRQCDLQGQTITAAGVALGLTYDGARASRAKALRKLGQDTALKALAEAHGLDRRTNWHYHRGLTAWRTDWMSSTEKLAFWRMDVKKS